MRAIGDRTTMTSTAGTWREHASRPVIKIARRLFANTPIQRFALTTRIYTKVFRFGSPGDEVSVNFRGVRLDVPTNDATIAPGLVGGFYERIELDVFERLATISKTVVDVGANIGLYSCIAAHRMPSGGRVVAFEPVPENLRYLKRNLEGNERTAQVVVEELAVGQTSGEIQIYLAAGSIGTHSPSAKNAFGSTTSITVPEVSLDDYAQQKLGARSIDLLKVDVEGYEGAVLRGARKTLQQDKPTLLIEFVPDHLANCDFSPEEFLDLIFETYDDIFLVDEPRETFKPCGKGDLVRYSARGHKNANLIAVSKSRRAGHQHVIESIRAALRE
jgi:FkbM family methyltransferase